MRGKNSLLLQVIYRNCFLASHFGIIPPLDIMTGNRLDVYYRSSGGQWTSYGQGVANTTKVSEVTVLISSFWCLEKSEAHVLSQADSHWFVFSETILSCWEHMLISLLGYDPIQTVGSMAESSLLSRSQNVCFSANYKWLLKRFDGLGLCQVSDRTLMKKQFTLRKTKLCFSTFPKHCLRGPLRIIFN